MRHHWPWRTRIILGVIAGALVAFVWVRREAYIATTPVGLVTNAEPPPARVIPSEVNPDASVGANEVEEFRSVSPRDVGTRSLNSARDDAGKGYILLSIPFVSQAPFRVWDLPYKEFCEEASVLTVHYWKQGVRPPAADQVDRDLKDIQAWETANLRTWEDTTAEETARILREKFGHPNTRVVRSVTVADITRELNAGRPVIVPAAGRELSSPYYKPPGPLYHMLVIIGYDEATREFMTNDVGTNTKGAGFRFTYDDLYGSMGDWSVERGAPDTSQKVMIVVP